MEGEKKAHVWAATYSCCMVSIVAFERAEREVAEQSQSVRGSNFFLLFKGGEIILCCHTKDSLTRCFKLGGAAWLRGVAPRIS